MSAPRSDEGGSAIWVLRAVRGPTSHKHSKPKWQRAKALGAETKGFYGFGLNLFRSRGIHCQCVDAHYVLLCVFEALSV